jgi:hypothetical protein
MHVSGSPDGRTGDPGIRGVTFDSSCYLKDHDSEWWRFRLSNESVQYTYLHLHLHLHLHYTHTLSNVPTACPFTQTDTYAIELLASMAGVCLPSLRVQDAYTCQLLRQNSASVGDWVVPMDRAAPSSDRNRHPS